MMATLHDKQAGHDKQARRPHPKAFGV